MGKEVSKFVPDEEDTRQRILPDDLLQPVLYTLRVILHYKAFIFENPGDPFHQVHRLFNITCFKPVQYVFCRGKIEKLSPVSFEGFRPVKGTPGIGKLSDNSVVKGFPGNIAVSLFLQSFFNPLLNFHQQF
ncbi:hypothetical protein [Desulfofundulus thermocisternus]|uniref:hypothetical protein n=1 Tax=Desulfofundulus thermocisternus TaxID=42471 RepID=UPI0012FF415A|nr:hypothetical protein [Desulfofundulus thermocisternus]